MLCLLYLKMVYIVEIKIISAFHGYMTCSNIIYLFFLSDDFTLSPLGVPPAVRWNLKVSIKKDSLLSQVLKLWCYLEFWTYLISCSDPGFDKPAELTYLYYLFRGGRPQNLPYNIGILLNHQDPEDLLLTHFQDGCPNEDYVEEFVELSHQVWEFTLIRLTHSWQKKIYIFTWLSNIYRWKIYLWHVSSALRIPRLKCINQHKYIHCLPWWMVVYTLYLHSSSDAEHAWETV